MDFLLITLSLSVLAIALGLFANRARDRRHWSFQLEANCLLTRWPVLFVTGPRSFFYFARYWNIYPTFLAEHGYEVYTAHLPWRNKHLRLERFKQFLSQQESQRRGFHLFMDSSSLAEFERYLRETRPATVISLTEIANAKAPDVVQGLSPFPMPFARLSSLRSTKNPRGPQAWSYQLHRLTCFSSPLASLSTLGALEETGLGNARLLLHRCRQLAESDLREN